MYVCTTLYYVLEYSVFTADNACLKAMRVVDMTWVGHIYGYYAMYNELANIELSVV